MVTYTCWDLSKTILVKWPQQQIELTHWGRVTHICVSKITIIGPDNGLSPERRQAIIWTNAGIWLIQILGTNFNEILSKIHAFSLKKMHLKMSSGKWRPFCLGLNELISKLSCAGHVVTYTCWDLSKTILVKWPQQQIKLISKRSCAGLPHASVWNIHKLLLVQRTIFSHFWKQIM